MRLYLLSGIGLALFAALPLAPQDEDPAQAIKRVLNDFHLAAAEADGERYLAHLAPDAVFFGTDASERWPYDDYAKRMRPAFEQGRSFENVALDQNVFVSERGDVAWFDERLERGKYGVLRATGVLRKTEAGWKIVQFHLTLPIPNAIIQDVVKLVRATER